MGSLVASSLRTAIHTLWHLQIDSSLYQCHSNRPILAQPTTRCKVAILITHFRSSTPRLSRAILEQMLCRNSSQYKTITNLLVQVAPLVEATHSCPPLQATMARQLQCHLALFRLTVSSTCIYVTESQKKLNQLHVYSSAWPRHSSPLVTEHRIELSVATFYYKFKNDG